MYLQCPVNESGSVLKWDGYGFDCPSNNTIDNNTLPLEVPDNCSSQSGECGPYSGNLTCPSESSTEVVSWLNFTANYSMNRQTVKCSHKNIDITYPIRVGSKFLQFIENNTSCNYTAM